MCENLSNEIFFFLSQLLSSCGQPIFGRLRLSAREHPGPSPHVSKLLCNTIRNWVEFIKCLATSYIV